MISRLLLMLAILICGTVQVHADIRKTIESVASTDTLVDINVPNTQTVYTKSYSLINQGVDSIAYMYKATSSGTIGVSIQAERSFDRPTTEATADAKYVVWNTTATTADATWKMATLDTVVMPYYRFKITGTGSNHNSTTVQIKVQKQ